MGRRIGTEADEAPVENLSRRNVAVFRLRLGERSAELYDTHETVRRELPDLKRLEVWEAAIDRLGLTTEYRRLLKGGSS